MNRICFIMNHFLLAVTFVQNLLDNFSSPMQKLQIAFDGDFCIRCWNQCTRNNGENLRKIAIVQSKLTASLLELLKHFSTLDLSKLFPDSIFSSIWLENVTFLWYHVKDLHVYVLLLDLIHPFISHIFIFAYSLRYKRVWEATSCTWYLPK